MPYSADRKKVYEIDGNEFDDLEGFFDAVESALSLPDWFGRNLNAFNDVLRGGFGTPDEGFVFRWKNSARSRDVLGFPATVIWLQKTLAECHPSNRDSVAADIIRAKKP
jgi:RNAse (barnase) inhibitor barstar